MSDDTPRASRVFTARRVAVGLVAATAVAGLAFASAPSGPPPGVIAAGPVAAAPSLVAPPVATAARGGVGLTARLDRSRVLVGGDGLVRAELTLSAEAEAAVEAVPSDFIVVLDRSSSMSGAKFADALGALRGLIARLAPADRLSIVSYGGDARVDVALEHADPAAVARWGDRLAWLSPGGSTNIGAALDLADALVQGRSEAEGRPARVLLLSDGEPTAGDTHPDALLARARRAAERGYVLGAVGIGLQFNELLMSGLADAGTGNFHSLHAEGGLEAVLAGEFDAARGTVASGLAVTLQPGAGVQVVDAAGYPLERVAGGMTFRPGGLFAGQSRRIWVTLRLPADRPADAVDLGRIGMSFTRDGRFEALAPTPLGAVAAVVDEQRFVAGLDKQAWEASVVDGRFADVEKRLAALVRAGDAASARALLDGHVQHTAALNRTVGSAAVDAHLAEVARRRAALDDAFTGADQAHKRNVFSKLNIASGWSRSRAGSLR